LTLLSLKAVEQRGEQLMAAKQVLLAFDMKIHLLLRSSWQASAVRKHYSQGMITIIYTSGSTGPLQY
jgi:long-subunit acyl-CoA synthetase (AMP-forming)